MAALTENLQNFQIYILCRESDPIAVVVLQIVWSQPLGIEIESVDAVQIDYICTKGSMNMDRRKFLGLVCDKLLEDNHRNIVTPPLFEPGILYDYWKEGFRPRQTQQHQQDIVKKDEISRRLIMPIDFRCTGQQGQDWINCLGVGSP